MKRQQGLAAVTAILIVAVAASAATLMLAQQSAMLDQTMLVATRAQADQYSRAGFDWVRGVLLEDALGPQLDSLDEGWAQPIAALPVERAVVSGVITDEQGKFNLNNLVQGVTASKPDIEVFKRILASQGLAPDLADAVADWIDGDDDLVSTAGAESSYYLALKRPYRAANTAITQIEELYRVRGFDANAVRKLRPYVTAVAPPTPLPNGPAHTTVNINTASEVVLQALLPAQPPGDIAKWVAGRKGHPMKDKDAIRAWAKNPEPGALDALDVKSSYFLARINVVQDDVELASEALLQRPDRAAPVIIWRRSRF
jgi:general secretion pathway protein K